MRYLRGMALWLAAAAAATAALYSYEGNTAVNVGSYRGSPYYTDATEPFICGHDSTVTITTRWFWNWNSSGLDAVRVNPITGVILGYKQILYVSPDYYFGAGGLAALPNDDIYTVDWIDGGGFSGGSEIGDTSPKMYERQNDPSYYNHLAVEPNGQYYWCHRKLALNGPCYHCRSAVGSAAVLISFPSGYSIPSYLEDIAAAADASLFTVDGPTIKHFTSSGSLLSSWNAPTEVVDLTVDGDGNVLALSAVARSTYVYSSNGSLLGSFTAPYASSFLSSADMGPDNKYYVIESISGGTTPTIYRFAAAITGITPTSLGKLKAIYK